MVDIKIWGPRQNQHKGRLFNVTDKFVIRNHENTITQFENPIICEKVLPNFIEDQKKKSPTIESGRAFLFRSSIVDLATLFGELSDFRTHDCELPTYLLGEFIVYF